MKRSREPENDPEDWANEEDATDYFSAYGNLSVHTLMLQDGPRMEAYIAALQQHAHAIRGKRVLDVGAGTGVLSMLCARICQPAEVLAVEATESTAHLARELIQANNMSDIVKVVNCRVEDLKEVMEPKGHGVKAYEPFDVVISEWMGFYLFHEAMMDSVLWARDNLCIRNPLLLPSSCRLVAAPWSANDLHSTASSWANYLPSIGGLDFSEIGRMQWNSRLGQPQVECFDESELLGEPETVVELDLQTCDQLVMSPIGGGEAVRQTVQLHVKKPGNFRGVLFWFECGFGGPVLKTGPRDPPTHWKQTGLLLGCDAAVHAGDVLPLTVVLAKDLQDAREYSITIET